ncbi:helix-turn-helix domain-containing protein [Acidicapsa dinghuensis]|uniref:Helix-turn-helix domain-containing protein n=1 Tax=Acidicapsa dinghuensis TaxID=2218256 RepID=A0ABW1ED24_9BACT|nr:helix-turn-helix transcriptional regulator [Acidicapsa dinghuensis]
MKKAKPAETRKSRKARTAKFQGAYDTLLERLIAAREKKGLTQHQVSSMMGRSPNFMTKCESGQRTIDVTELLELAQIYSKPVSYFFPS